MDVVVLVGVLAALAQLAIPYHLARRTMCAEPRPILRHHFVAMCALALISWVAVGWDCIDRNYNAPRILPLVYSWGSADKEVFYMVIDGKSLGQYKALSGVMLITRIQYVNVDGMKDTFIEKSQIYSITDGPMTIAHVGTAHLRKTLNTKLSLEFNLVVVRSMFSADQIRTLGDVESLGGKILSSVAMLVTFELPTVPSFMGPLAACPPVLTPSCKPEEK